MDEEEINLAAEQAMARYGAEADARVAERMRLLLVRHEFDEAARWMKIMQLIIEAEDRTE